MASGPSSSARRMERTMSQNITVTCLRSPSSSPRDSRTLSARGRGTGRRALPAPRGAPHTSQKRFP